MHFIQKTMKSDLKPKEELIECEICNEKFLVNKRNKVEKCGHAFCSGCWYDSLSVKIKENKLPSIKCLKYECQEKLTDIFIINLLKSDINLIKKYKQYKLELEVINDPNKKLCPYPNCDSYLELKEINNKEVTCKNNHTFWFICLKKPHGKLPCDNKLDKSIAKYAKNNFVKKCPKCSIITEKNRGCNHITCSKCGFQWCWLCNEEYNIGHYKEGKCRGFQFFQPKDDYDIKLMMEGKITTDKLSWSQRQLDVDYVLNRGLINQRQVNYNAIKCSEKLYKIFKFILLGNWPFILEKFRMNNIYYRTIYYILSFSLFFQLIFLNIITFLFLLIFLGFKKFISQFNDFYHIYIANIIIILVNLLLGTFCMIIYMRDGLYEKLGSIQKVFFNLFYLLMSTIVCFPHRILINLIGIIITFIVQKNFSLLTARLDENFERIFNYHIYS